MLATGEAHSVREFVELAFAEVGRELVWAGEGLAEKGVDRRTGRLLVEIDPRYFRPLEVDHLQGDASKARQRAGLATARYGFAELVREMVAADLAQVRREHLAQQRSQARNHADRRRPSERPAGRRASTSPAVASIVAGHRGMVGSAAVVRRLASEPVDAGHRRRGRSSTSPDRRTVEAWMRRQRPDVVVRGRGRVGGILANAQRPVDFLARQPAHRDSA